MLSREELEQSVKTIFQDVLQVDTSRIRADSDLREELQLSSLQVIELAFAAEEALGIEIDNSALRRMRKFSDVIDELEQALLSSVTPSR